MSFCPRLFRSLLSPRLGCWMQNRPLIDVSKSVNSAARGLPLRNAVGMNLSVSHCSSNISSQQVLQDPITDEEAAAISNSVVGRINEDISGQKTGRLFAVVHIMGKQFRVTDSDLIVLHGHWAPAVGEVIQLEKVLLVAGAGFTLVGRPLLEPGLVTVKATVIEKSLSHIKTVFVMKRRKSFKKFNFRRMLHSTLRINSVTINPIQEGSGTSDSQSVD